MWTYAQRDGDLQHDGTHIAYGYSGSEPGQNCPADQSIPDLGPIPAGRYAIGTAISTTHLGPLAMPLTPDPTNQMFGRSGFWIHGDSIAHPGDGSLGCIVLAHPVRLQLAQSSDRDLLVTPSPTPPPPTSQVT
jgi:hypothetical protein